MKALPRTATALVAVVGLWATGAITSTASAWDTSPLNRAVVAQHHLCGANDLPETGLQGDVPKADQASGRAKKGYNCGLALVGHALLNFGGRQNANANMAWAGHCAYVSGGGAPIVPQTKPKPPPGAGVAVVDVSDSAHPKHVANLRDPGDLTASETLNAITTPSGRSILVIGQYGNDAVSVPKPMDIYDVSNPDCTKSKHLMTYYWPANIHNLTISPDGRYVFATIPLQAVDISGLWAKHPAAGVKYLGNINDAMTGTPVAPGPTNDIVPEAARSQTHPSNSSHEAWVSADDKILYAGAQTAETETFTIMDISQWLKRDSSGKPAGPPKVISQQAGRGHSIRTATINGVPYVLHSEESVFGTAYGCIPQEQNPFAGPAQPWLTNIQDPANPVLVSQMGLQINEAQNCPAQLNSKVNDSVHYHDVDDPTDTTFVMASMWNAGIRLFDVRDPTKPTEVAYFNPADVDPTSSVKIDHAWGHIRYIAAKNEIWFATADGGFWVVRMEGKVRAYLDLDHKDQRHGRRALHLAVDDPGHPGTMGAALIRPLGGYVDITPYYCTLAPLLAPSRPVG
ncbi:MAG: LVIVD repeat-containing protein [Acidimicrobiales bacterium]